MERRCGRCGRKIDGIERLCKPACEPPGAREPWHLPVHDDDPYGLRFITRSHGVIDRRDRRGVGKAKRKIQLALTREKVEPSSSGAARRRTNSTTAVREAQTDRRARHQKRR